MMEEMNSVKEAMEVGSDESLRAFVTLDIW
jgi:hypothetical protein